MAGPQNGYEQLARDAAARIDRARATGEQLTFLPDEPRPGGAVATRGDGAGDSGSGKRGKGRVSSQMRDWLEHRGYRLPEDVLVQMAGLASHEDAVLTAMQAAERVLNWAYDPGDDPLRAQKRPSETKRIEVFMQLYTIQLRAAEALLPYGAPKATPDVNVNPNVTFVVPMQPSGAADRSGSARDVTPRPGSRMAPPPLPSKNKQNQQVSGASDDASDTDSRTE
ncbi:hypothetical protein ACVDG3_18195 [Meridianimarinicoccus sp. RP-17]|uniref:hypothetical protein n=1 Tax=Meridianimarinicoccus zhengii TaxID=2056810 RepID=UPI0013A6D059|nr:hypothetical protein [Phycocomes zhengii]